MLSFGNILKNGGHKLSNNALLLEIALILKRFLVLIEKVTIAKDKLCITGLCKITSVFEGFVLTKNSDFLQNASFKLFK